MPEEDLVSSRRFEADIASFLKSLGMHHVGHGPTNLFDRVQVDASGGTNGCFLAVECHTSIAARRRSVRRKIKEHRGIIEQVRQGLADKGLNKKYPRVKLVLATRNIELNNSDRAFARRRPKVYLWDDEFLDYYEKGVAKIGVYAANEVLGELEVPLPVARTEGDLCVPALRTRLRGRTVYLFYARPRALLDIAYVARRERGSEQYYQRFLKKDRIEAVGDFLRDRRRQRFFANNLILSLQEKVRFSPHRRFGSPNGLQVGWLYLPRKERSAWVIDGQHRLYGFTRAKNALKELQVPVAAFASLPESQQAEFFLTINKEQKPVDPNLLWDLEGEIYPNGESGVISRAVKKLNELPPFSGHIFVPRKGSSREGRHVYLANLCDGIEARGLGSPRTKNMREVDRNPLYRTRAPQRVALLTAGLRDYFTWVANLFARDWRLGRKGFIFTNNGLNVMLRLYEQMLVHFRHKPTHREIQSILRPLAQYYRKRTATATRLTELRAAGLGEGGRTLVTLEFLRVIKDRVPSFNSVLLTGPSPRDTAVRFEGDLRQAFTRAMTAVDPNWWTNTGRVPDRIRLRAEARVAGRAGSRPSNGLDLGEIEELIRLGANWTDVFSRILVPWFRTQTRFSSHLQELVEYRNTLMHAGGYLEPHQHELFRVYLGEMSQAFSLPEHT